MGWLIGFVGFVVMVIGIIGVIHPMARLYLPTRGRAALAVLLGVIILVIAAQIPSRVPTIPEPGAVGTSGPSPGPS